MKELLKRVGIALLAGAAAAVGTALGEVARDVIKERLGPKPPAPPPAPVPTRRRRKRRGTQ